jgi:hypothetical protein
MLLMKIETADRVAKALAGVLTGPPWEWIIDPWRPSVLLECREDNLLFLGRAREPLNDYVAES